MKKSDL